MVAIVRLFLQKVLKTRVNSPNHRGLPLSGKKNVDKPAGPVRVSDIRAGWGSLFMTRNNALATKARPPVINWACIQIFICLHYTSGSKGRLSTPDT